MYSSFISRMVPEQISRCMSAHTVFAGNTDGGIESSGVSRLVIYGDPNANQFDVAAGELGRHSDVATAMTAFDAN